MSEGAWVADGRTGALQLCPLPREGAGKLGQDSPSSLGSELVLQSPPTAGREGHGEQGQGSPALLWLGEGGSPFPVTPKAGTGNAVCSAQ